MKKTVLLGCILALSTIAFSQKTQFGIKGGVNVSKLDIDNVDEDNLESKVGFHVGGLAHIHLNRNWAIQPELVYSTQGGEWEGVGEYTLGYVNVPVMVQYMFDGGFRVQAGPQLGILTNAEFEFPNGIEVDLDDDDLETVDVGLGFGLAFISNSGFGVDARYNLGLTNVNESGRDMQNRVFQVGVFYQFRK